MKCENPNDQRVFKVVVVVLWGSGGSANNANNATSKLVVDIKVCVLG